MIAIAVSEDQVYPSYDRLLAPPLACGGVPPPAIAMPEYEEWSGRGRDRRREFLSLCQGRGVGRRHQDDFPPPAAVAPAVQPPAEVPTPPWRVQSPPRSRSPWTHPPRPARRAETPAFREARPLRRKVIIAACGREPWSRDYEIVRASHRVNVEQFLDDPAQRNLRGECGLSAPCLQAVAMHPTLLHWLGQLLKWERTLRNGTFVFLIECRRGRHRSVATAYLLARAAKHFLAGTEEIQLWTPDRGRCRCQACQGARDLLRTSTPATEAAVDRALQAWRRPGPIL